MAETGLVAGCSSQCPKAGPLAALMARRMSAGQEAMVVFELAVGYPQDGPKAGTVAATVARRLSSGQETLLSLYAQAVICSQYETG